MTTCSMCGKVSKRKRFVKYHLSENHSEIVCFFCGLTLHHNLNWLVGLIQLAKRFL
ncbi:MAG: hypothetical protein ACREBJ_06595 [Nitrosotalea sp.]